MNSVLPSSPRIIFHVVDEKIFPTKLLDVKFDFCISQKIDLNKTFFLGNKYFTKLKDRFKANIILTTDQNTIKFIITIYYGENHITIFRTNNIDICYEIIQMFFNSLGNPLNRIAFGHGNNNEIFVTHHDSIENKFRRRFLAVNFPINIKLNINNLNKMKENSNYKINILSKDIIIQENQESTKIEKKEIKDLDEMKKINVEIDKIVSDEDLNKIEKIKNELSPYYEYFNQYLFNKGEFNWSQYEFICYYHYFKFKIFLLYKCGISSRKIEYYFYALKIYSNIYEQLKHISDISDYDKICAITSLYRKLKCDAENKENKKHSIGEYKLICMKDNNNNKIKCYNLVYKFVNEIIDNLKENSFITLPLLQVNSGFSKNINSKDEKEIFELSMININMIKRHLKSLVPKIIFIIRHPIIELERASTDKMTGNIFIYESSIFKNNINKRIDDIINNYPEDAAVIISFVILHELFMHKKIRSNPDVIPGRETPSKFIGPKLDIKNFYYSNNKHNLDLLSFYNKKEDKNNKIPEDGECGRMLEYFFENEKFGVIRSLKKYLGFGDILNKIDLIVAEKLDDLHSYVKNKIEKGEAQLLYVNKKSKRNEAKEYIYGENDEDEKGRKTDGEEEAEEEEGEEEELSEETKNIIKSQTHCY